MDLINELGTDLAVAFLVEKRYRQKIDSEEALELISRVTDLLESAGTDPDEGDERERSLNSAAAH